MVAMLAGLALKYLGKAGVDLALGFVKQYMVRKDIRDKERMAIALELYENATEAYDFLRKPGGTSVRVRRKATGIRLSRTHARIP